MGHVLKDCPSCRAFIASPDGNGYISASDVEDDLVLAANATANSDDEEDNTFISSDAAKSFPSLLVQCVLTSQERHDEDDQKIQRNNLFHMFFVV